MSPLFSAILKFCSTKHLFNKKIPDEALFDEKKDDCKLKDFIYSVLKCRREGICTGRQAANMLQLIFTYCTYLNQIYFMLKRQFNAYITIFYGVN